MDAQDKLTALRDAQEKVMDDLTAIIEEMRTAKALQENKSLQQELADCRLRLADLQEKHEAAMRANRHLNVALKEQILDEKLNILKVSRRKLDTYFVTRDRDYENALLAWESQAKGEIERLARFAAQNLEKAQAGFLTKLQALGAELQSQLTEQRTAYTGKKREFSEEVAQQMEQLSQSGVSEEVVRQRMRQNELELTVGLSWANKIGILLILFGMGAAAKYTYSMWFTNHMKGVSFFLLGGLLLVCGEWFYRREKEVFAGGLIGGGISVLYGAIFYSCFLLKVISLYTGLGFSLLVTAAAVSLSLRYRSRTICALGLIGGYLPFITYLFTYGFKGLEFYIAMGYLFNLNLVVLLVSWGNRWSLINMISFLLHVPSFIYLVFTVPSKPVGMLYAVLVFSLYVAAVLAYPFRYKTSLRRQDILLLGGNTFVSCLVLYGLFREAGLQAYNGLLALGFCLLYMALAKLADLYIPEEKATILLFDATALTFAVLLVPFQLGLKWLSLGWLVEGVILILYGSKNRVVQLEKAGWLVFGLCLAVFYLHDYLPILPAAGLGANRHFDVKYTAVVAGMLLVTVHYLREIKNQGLNRYGIWLERIMDFKVFSLINLWLYALYMGNKGIHYWLSGAPAYEFYHLLARAFITLGVGYTFSRIPLIRDRNTRYLSNGLLAFGILLCLYLNLSTPVLPAHSSGFNAAQYFAFAVLCFFNLLVLAAVGELLLVFIRARELSLELYPLYLSIYFTGTITAILTSQFQLGVTHLAFSGTYLCIAVGAIIYGFQKQFLYVRRFGLALALFATTKLFIFDLAFLTSLSRIFAYFCFGLVLLGISYMYQKLENGGEAKKGERNI